MHLLLLSVTAGEAPARPVAREPSNSGSVQARILIMPHVEPILSRRMQQRQLQHRQYRPGEASWPFITTATAYAQWCGLSGQFTCNSNVGTSCSLEHRVDMIMIKAKRRTSGLSIYLQHHLATDQHIPHAIKHLFNESTPVHALSVVHCEQCKMTV